MKKSFRVGNHIWGNLVTAKHVCWQCSLAEKIHPRITGYSVHRKLRNVSWPYIKQGLKRYFSIVKIFDAQICVFHTFLKNYILVKNKYFQLRSRKVKNSPIKILISFRWLVCARGWTRRLSYYWNCWYPKSLFHHAQSQHHLILIESHFRHHLVPSEWWWSDFCPVKFKV